MAAGNYGDFEATRQITISPAATIDIATGQITGQTLVYLCESVTTADDNYRDLYKTSEPLYVLRIPRECVDRAALTTTQRSGVWEYRKSLNIPHCGVELVKPA